MKETVVEQDLEELLRSDTCKSVTIQKMITGLCPLTLFNFT